MSILIKVFDDDKKNNRITHSFQKEKLENKTRTSTQYSDRYKKLVRAMQQNTLILSIMSLEKKILLKCGKCIFSSSITLLLVKLIN